MRTITEYRLWYAPMLPMDPAVHAWGKGFHRREAFNDLVDGMASAGFRLAGEAGERSRASRRGNGCRVYAIVIWQETQS